MVASPVPDGGVLALDAALEQLSGLDPRQARVVELRFFGGLSVKETAEALHVSPETVMRDWKLAKAWLLRRAPRRRHERDRLSRLRSAVGHVGCST